MTDTTAAAIEALMTCRTEGRAVQFHPDYCPEAKDAPMKDWDTSHHISVIRADGSRYRIAEFRHSAEAAFHSAARDLVPALAAERDAALRDRDAGAKDYCALMERHDAEFVRAEKAETEADALRGEVARMVMALDEIRLKDVVWDEEFQIFAHGPIAAIARAALTSKGGEGCGPQ